MLDFNAAVEMQLDADTNSLCSSESHEDDHAVELEGYGDRAVELNFN